MVQHNVLQMAIANHFKPHGCSLDDAVSGHCSRIKSAFIRAVADCEVVQKKFSFPPANILLNKWDPVPKLIIHGVDKNGQLDRDFPMHPDFQIASIVEMAQEAGIDAGTVKILTTNPNLDIDFDFHTVIAAFKKPEDAQKMIDWARSQKIGSVDLSVVQLTVDGVHQAGPA